MRQLSLLWIALSLAACAGGRGSGSSASPATGAAVAGAGCSATTPTAPQERWWKGDLHVHTLYSVRSRPRSATS